MGVQGVHEHAHDERTDTRLTDLVDITTAAKSLGITRSTLSRYVKRYAGALNPVRDGKSTLVSLEALTRHRSENITIDEQATQQVFGGPKKVSDAKTRKAEVDANRAELDYLERVGQLVASAVVVEAARTSMANMKATADKVSGDIADKIAAKIGTEARLVRPFLREMTAGMEQSFSSSMFDLQSEIETKSAAADKLAGELPRPDYVKHVS